MLPLDPPLSPTAARGGSHPLQHSDAVAAAVFAANPDDPDAQVFTARRMLRGGGRRQHPRATGSRPACRNRLGSRAPDAHAVRIGLRLWGREIAGERPVDWANDEGGSLFVTAVVGYGRALRKRGLQREARECADFVLRLDPQDRMGAQRTIMGRVGKAGMRGPSGS